MSKVPWSQASRKIKANKVIQITKNICIKSGINYDDFVKRTKCVAYGIPLYK